ncbi:hypothetical protein [Shinella zoogloeoides]|uniref:hypothetical protein n=1 Tax=Shinella zoogloeoides TaxID=352475 RepID=UPI0027400750|nr:hypothetical protein [Shinella zoogloeoides]WLR91010.1 hypothetical protein Q9316_00245 [Shinella zoogloeoides]
MTGRVSLGKYVDGTHRLRVSAPGFNVDDPGLIGQQVVFDSYIGGHGMIIMSGTFAVSGGAGYANTKLVSWPALNARPLVYMLVSVDGGRRKTFHSMSSFKMKVGNDGIYADGAPSSSMVFYYAALNVAVGA